MVVVIVNNFAAKYNTRADSVIGTGKLLEMLCSLTSGFIDAENNDNEDYYKKYDTTN